LIAVRLGCGSVARGACAAGSSCLPVLLRRDSILLGRRAIGLIGIAIDGSSPPLIVHKLSVGLPGLLIHGRLLCARLRGRFASRSRSAASRSRSAASRSR
jgi:hypothetical protein